MATTQKVLRYTIIGGALALLITPLFVSGSLFFPFITGKNFFFRIVVELIFGAWIALMIISKRYYPRRSFVMAFAGAYAFFVLLATVFGADSGKSFWSNFERMEGAITTFHLFAYFLVATSVFTTRRLWDIFWHTSLGVSLVIAFYGLLQWTGSLAIHQSTSRLDATFGNASYLAIYALIHIFIALWYFRSTGHAYRWLYLAHAAFLGAILFNTGTRGAILGLIISVVATLLTLGIYSESKYAKRALFGSLIGIAVLLGLFWTFRNSAIIQRYEVLERFASISLKDRTTQSRFVIWGMALKGFKENPILGTGPENFGVVFNKYYDPVLWRQEVWFDRAHNIIFDRLTESGILGFLAFFGMIGVAVIYSWRRRYFNRQETALLSGLIIAYLVHNFFVFDNITSSLLLYSVLGFVHMRVVSHSAESNEPQIAPVSTTVTRGSLAAIAGIATIALVYMVNVPGYKTASTLLDALISGSRGNVQETQALFNKALAYNSFGETEVREQYARFGRRVLSASDKQIPPETKQKIFSQSLHEMELEVKSSPESIRQRLFLAGLYNASGQYDKAITLLKDTIKLAPRKQVLFFELASSYINKGEYDNALATTKKAYEFDTEYQTARRWYAVSAAYMSQYDLVDKLIAESVKENGRDTLTSTEFIAAYARRGNFNRVADAWKVLISNSPNNAQYHVSLGATYLQLGRRAESIREIERAIDINPAFKEQGNKIIRDIKNGLTF